MLCGVAKGTRVYAVFLEKSDKHTDDKYLIKGFPSGCFGIQVKHGTSAHTGHLCRFCGRTVVHEDVVALFLVVQKIHFF